MAISGDYPQPVYVNGFSCKNCTDVENAKKHIDPAHPKSGPFGINADTDPTRDQAVRFDGRLSGLDVSTSSASATSEQATAPGRVLNITA
ncbi:hypothetical protein ABI_29030 [Asticcacaulis biprosthecium C19]|uniref:Uncharacterized protein n=1 Tax=Asticcacaulis biprosthecium C19 TaxID=715226 RepID=F4QMP5_9CAUL|nr:hypothetical protein [Asticcacaulis biprosthecium]EGF91486.1 hypothetical protein ABI_29030 [Asticcacaulis biprosthecium C19]